MVKKRNESQASPEKFELREKNAYRSGSLLRVGREDRKRSYRLKTVAQLSINTGNRVKTRSLALSIVKAQVVTQRCKELG